MATDDASGTQAADEIRAIEETLAQGDYQKALSQCAEAFAVPLSRFCMAFTGSQTDSEALVQETLLAAYSSFPQYKGPGTLRGWIFGIARRACGRHVEMRSRTTGAHPSQGGASSQAKQARDALAKLKPSEREAMVLRYEAGLSVKELAVAIGVDETQARKRVSRALVRLGAEMAKE